MPGDTVILTSGEVPRKKKTLVGTAAATYDNCSFVCFVSNFVVWKHLCTHNTGKCRPSQLSDTLAPRLLPCLGK